MFGKLFKHEFKATGKVLLPLNLALIGVTIIGMIMLGLKVFSFNGMVSTLLAISLVLFYILAIIALFIVTYIYLMVRFYRSMYSSEGYLTHTLPVSTFSVLNTKILVSVFWAFLTMALSSVSVLALILTAVSSTGDISSADWSVFWTELEYVFGMSAGSLTAWMLLFMLVSCFSGLLMIYCSISIGQLFNKYKGGAAIVTYVIIYIVLQVVNMIVSLSRSLHAMNPFYYATIYDEAETFRDIFGGTFTSSLIQSMILIIIYYAVCAYISNKKLNLE